MVTTLLQLWNSTESLYRRFALQPNIKNAVNGIVEESAEVIEAISEENAEHLAEEVADTIVVLISACLARGLTYKELEKGILKVTSKNDAKNHRTHIVFNDKISRIEKVIVSETDS